MNSRAVGNPWAVTSAWALAAVLMFTFLYLKLELSFDLSAFFPRQAGPQSEVLLKQLSSGPGSRIMVAGINGASPEERIETGRLMVDTLQSNPAFAGVYNGESNFDASEIPEPLASGYPLLADIDYRPEALQSVLEQRLADLSFGGGNALRSLVARDPFLVTLDLVTKLGPGSDSDQPWVAEDGSAVIAAQSHAPGTDLEAQLIALQSVESAFEELKTHPDLNLIVTGVGAFGIQLRAIIQEESRLLGIMAGSAVFLVLLLVYRSLKLALLAAIPLGLGYLAGMTAVVIAFDTVHGITLAFGFTLLGVTVDYPLHLFSHAQREGGKRAIRSIWPTLRLGAASTATAYLAMVFSGAQGLAQLGVFTAVGVIVAVLVTRTMLPLFLPEKSGHSRLEESQQNCRFYPAGLAILAAFVFILGWQGRVVWNDAMDTLSPVPKILLQADNQLRSATATADMRYLISVESADLEMLLAECERVDQRLQIIRDEGLLTGWSSVTTLMPSQATQQRRLQSIPDADQFVTSLSETVAETAFVESAFAPFAEIILSIDNMFPILPGSFDETPFATWRDAHLLELSGKWVALYTLEQPDAVAVPQRVAEWGESVRWIDLRNASETLMRDFRHDATTAVGAAALVIILLLLVQRVGIFRLIWIFLTVGSALAISVCTVMMLHGYLTLVHLVALLLVLGLGLDYALFFSRGETSSARKSTVQSILACSASTMLAFGILAFSSIPLLKFIGLTVASGSLASLLLAWLGSRGKSKRQSV